MISYFANEIKANTYYLSMTRGDGGQNLIGTEISELLGALRTQELLAARRIDGGNQMFTRANDFGYSKNTEETIKIWDDEKVKSDIVWAVRNIRPDIIVNRFDHDSSGKTHGHHSASAMLSYELFEKYGDPNAYKEQLELIDVWQPKSLFFNTSWWFYGGRDKFAEADKTNLYTADIGVYYPILGYSNSEIAALSRSQHKCQGFGSTGSRGSELEYLMFLKGERPTDKEDIFAGLDITWTRVKGGRDIQLKIDKIISDFNYSNPSMSVPALIDVARSIEKIKDKYWKEAKLSEINQIIVDCLGLYTEATTEKASACRADSISINIEITQRLGEGIIIDSYKIESTDNYQYLNETLTTNQSLFKTIKIKVPEAHPYTTPYWLTEKGSLGMYKVDDQKNIGKPESDPAFEVKFKFQYLGYSFDITKPVVYKYNSPEKGEVQQAFTIMPQATVGLKNDVVIFSTNAAQTIQVDVTAGTENLKGTLKLCTDQAWKTEPASHEVNIPINGQTSTFVFKLIPPDGESDALISPILEVGTETYSNKLIEIDYDHIPLQKILLPCEARVVRIPLEKKGKNIAYIMGAGDNVPASLRQIGYNVDELPVEDISLGKLMKYDAAVLGVRAYNKHDDIKFKQAELMLYVENGGNLIVQYNTSRGLATTDIGPYPLELSRSRVTVEEAPITMVNENHPLLNYPNKISSKDFDGWVQERGLYFADKWDERYTPIISCNDPGEEPLLGGILAAEYGKGRYVYTSMSWFRELPAGVPGAFRLFTNLISWGLDDTAKP
jgi:hypothetical protein